MSKEMSVSDNQLAGKVFFFYLILALCCFNIVFVSKQVDFMERTRHYMTNEERNEKLQQGVTELSSATSFKITAYMLPQVLSMISVNSYDYKKHQSLYPQDIKNEYKSWWIQSYNSMEHWIISIIVLILGCSIFRDLSILPVNGFFKFLYAITFLYFSLTLVIGIVVMIVVCFMGSPRSRKKTVKIC